LDVLKSLNIKILEELDTCYIGVANDSELSALNRFKVDFSILVKDIKGKDFFLIYSKSPEDIRKLEPFGNAIQIEENTILLRKEEIGISIPSEFQKKRLSKDSITKFLRAPPKIEFSEGGVRENEIIPLIIDERLFNILQRLTHKAYAHNEHFSSTSIHCKILYSNEENIE